MVGSLSPIDLCSAQASCIAWRNAISEKDYAPMTSMREPGDILRIATELELFRTDRAHLKMRLARCDCLKTACSLRCKSAWGPKQQRCGAAFSVSEAQALLNSVTNTARLSPSSAFGRPLLRNTNSVIRREETGGCTSWSPLCSRPRGGKAHPGPPFAVSKSPTAQY